MGNKCLGFPKNNGRAVDVRLAVLVLISEPETILLWLLQLLDLGVGYSQSVPPCGYIFYYQQEQPSMNLYDGQIVRREKQNTWAKQSMGPKKKR